VSSAGASAGGGTRVRMPEAQVIMGEHASMARSGTRLAGAPISWGVCEVPGWGYQLEPDRVLAEMRATGLSATEFGPDGFLPRDPERKAALLGSYGLAAVGGFVPVVLHDRAADPLPEVDRALAGFTAGATVLVLAAATGFNGYNRRPQLDDGEWRTLLSNLNRIAAHAAAAGVMTTLHPHVGTVVERPAEVNRVLDGAAVPLCLDSGHLLIGGTDPAELARQAGGRVAHVHLKDVDAGLAARVRGGELSYGAAVAAGMYRPLGRGDVDITGLMRALKTANYQGWYVLEQDTVLTAEPAGGEGPRGPHGPAADVRASVDYLRSLLQ
jgi:inosose dehydratase